MKVLAIDTATSLASVALTDGDRILAEYSVNNIKTHSKFVMPLISKIFEISGLKPDDIDLIGVSIGPGSFTGVRIGVATAKGLALALGKPVIGISTLDGLANNIRFADGVICPILDAREKQVNNAIYKVNNGFVTRLTDYRVTDVDELISEFVDSGEKVIFNGDGVFLYREFILQLMGDKAQIAPVNLLMPRAASIAGIAAFRMENGYYEKNRSVVPIYLKKSYAERVREKRNAEGK